MRRPSRLIPALALGLALLAGTGAGLADTVRESNGTITYVNARFGTTARFPAGLFPDELPAPTNGDGLGWSSPDGADLFIYARNNVDGETPRSVIALRAADDTVTYKASGDRWAVVSGYREGRIFYERYIFRGDLVHSVSIRYPESLRSTFDPLVGRITRSLSGRGRAS